MDAQQTIDGGEVPHPPPRPRALTDTQRELLRMIRALGVLRTAEAGRVTHAARGWCASRADFPRVADGGRPCCRWCGSDGLAAMRRLEARGLVRRVKRGVWKPTSA